MCTDDGRHGDRVVARLAWVQDDINPANPRWRPARFVLSDRRGEIVGATADHPGKVRLRCETCGRDLQRSEDWIGGCARTLIDAGVQKVELIHLIRLP